MEEFGNFLAQNWLHFVAIFMTAGAVVLGIIRKQPKVVVNKWTELLEEIGNRIPDLVIDAEKHLDSAFKKYDFVINRSLEIAKAINGAELTDIQAAQVIRKARTQLELVLTAPTKKGGLGREKKDDAI